MNKYFLNIYIKKFFYYLSFILVLLLTSCQTPKYLQVKKIIESDSIVPEVQYFINENFYPEEINCIEVLLTEGESIKITNLEIGKKLKNPFFDHIEFRTNNRFVYCIFEFAIGQAGGLGIWDAKIKEWCFWFSDELFCLSELGFNEEQDLFHGKCSFSYPMSPFGGTVDFEINSKRELKSKSYKYIGVDGKEVIGIGKFFDKET